MRMRLGVGVGAAVGYVLGSKAGRERYEELKRAAARVADNPVTQSAASTVRLQAERVESVVKGKLGKEQEPVGEMSSEEAARLREDFDAGEPFV